MDKKLAALLESDVSRMEVLKIVRSLALPDCYVAAGCIRNLVWDSLHSIRTPLNDIDVVFFDNTDKANVIEKNLTADLNKKYPQFHWQVKNQAFIHNRNGDSAYKNTLDAMSYWPEQETAVGAALKDDGSIELITCFGLEGLFAGKITHNPKRCREVFLQRVNTKNWLSRWHGLQLQLS